MKLVVTVERKERLRFGEPGNMPDPSMSSQEDRVRLTVGYALPDGRVNVEFILVVSLAESREIDVGEMLAVNIDLTPLGQAEANAFMGVEPLEKAE